MCAPTTQLNVATCGSIPLQVLTEPILRNAASAHLASLEPIDHRRFIHRLSCIIYNAVTAMYGTRVTI
jgi:hypothetical protein